MAPDVATAEAAIRAAAAAGGAGKGARETGARSLKERTSAAEAAADARGAGIAGKGDGGMGVRAVTAHVSSTLAAAAGGAGKGAAGRLLTRAAAAAKGAQEAAQGNSRAPSKRLPPQTIADDLHHYNGHDRGDEAGLRHVRLGRRQLSSLGSFLASLFGSVSTSRSNPMATNGAGARGSPWGSHTPSHTSAGAYKGFSTSGRVPPHSREWGLASLWLSLFLDEAQVQGRGEGNST